MFWPLQVLGQSQRPLQLDLPAILDLVAEPWRDGPAFEAELSRLLHGFAIHEASVPDTVADPFAWRRDGSFAAIPGLVPVGGYVLCNRIGIATRDALAGGASSRAQFQLYQSYLVESDLVEAWPETAVARVSCSISWDDSRAIAIIPEADLRGALDAVFARITRTMPDGQEGFHGADGYHLMATNGPRTTSVELYRADAVLSLRHQSLRFRSYLLAGGV